MKKILTIAAAIALFLPLASQSQPSNDTNRPVTRPATGQRPVGNKSNGGKPTKPTPPPGGGTRPPIGGTRPPSGGHHRPNRPARPRPPVVQRPRPGQYYWRGRWFNRFRAPAFVYPLGWHYHTWRPGDRLPALFIATQFFYDNFTMFGLEVPPPGYRWVRFGPDLILVNVRTREVEEVVYGVFF